MKSEGGEQEALGSLPSKPPPGGKRERPEYTSLEYRIALIGRQVKPPGKGIEKPSLRIGYRSFSSAPCSLGAYRRVSA
jgi:hypothetical protein